MPLWDLSRFNRKVRIFRNDVGFVSDELERNDVSGERRDMFRRDFLKYAGVAAATLAGGYRFGPALRDQAENVMSESRLEEEIAKKSESIRRTYRVEVTHDSELIEEDMIATVIDTKSELNRALDKTIRELAFFPPEFVRGAKLNRINLVRTMEKPVEYKGRKVTIGQRGRMHNRFGEDGQTTYKSLALSMSGNATNRYNEYGWADGFDDGVLYHEMCHALDEMTDEE